MKPVCRWLVDRLSRILEPDEQQAIMGDFEELQVTDTQAVRDLLGLIIRRQAILWKDWRPWLALLGLVGLIGVLLTQISFELSETLGMHLWVSWHFGGHFGTGLTMTQETEVFACESLAVIAWSWVSGFVLGSLSHRTIWINAALFYLVWLSFGASRLIAFPLTFGGAVLPLTLETLFFLLPSISGIRQGLRRRALGTQYAILLATVVGILTALATWTGGWWQIALEIWSEGAWHASISWQQRLVPFAAVSWPAAYLLAIASLQRWRGKSHGVADRCCN